MVLYKNVVKSILLLLSSLSVLCSASISPALPAMKAHFAHYPNIDLLVKFVVTIPNLFIAIFSPIMGLLLDHTDRKKILIVALLLYAISGTSGIYIDSIYLILLGRAFLGISLAAIFNIATVLIAEYFRNEQQRSKVIGLQVSCMSIGSIVYVMLSGYLADYNWRFPFLLYSMSLVIIPAIAIYILDLRNIRNRISANTIRKKQMLQYTKKEDNKPKGVQNNKVIAIIYFIEILNMTMYYMIPLQIPFLLNSFGNMNAKKISLAIAFQVLFSAIFAIKHRRLKKNRDFAVMCSMAFGLMAVSYMVISFAKSYLFVILGLGIYGIGMGFMMPNNALWVMSVTSSEKRGLIIGGLTTSIYLGKFLSPLVLQPIIKHSSSISVAYGVISIILLFTAILSVSLNEFFKHD